MRDFFSLNKQFFTLVILSATLKQNKQNTLWFFSDHTTDSVVEFFKSSQLKDTQKGERGGYLIMKHIKNDKAKAERELWAHSCQVLNDLLYICT